jgi:hypothetical protein
MLHSVALRGDRNEPGDTSSVLFKLNWPMGAMFGLRRLPSAQTTGALHYRIVNISLFVVGQFLLDCLLIFLNAVSGNRGSELDYR